MREKLQALARRLDLPEELLEGVARVTLTGSDRVRIENHRCLLSFSPETLEVGCGGQRLRLRGEDLRIVGMDRQEMLVTGRIIAVEVDGR